MFGLQVAKRPRHCLCCTCHLILIGTKLVVHQSVTECGPPFRFKAAVVEHVTGDYGNVGQPLVRIIGVVAASTKGSTAVRQAAYRAAVVVRPRPVDRRSGAILYVQSRSRRLWFLSETCKVLRVLLQREFNLCSRDLQLLDPCESGR